MKIIGLIITTLLILTFNHASSTEIPLEDNRLENQARILFRQIKCPVCNGQAIGDSNADIAADMRNSIRKKLKSGASEKEIKTFIAARYGKNTLFDPPYETNTIILWYSPFALLFLGIVLFIRKKN